MTNQRQTMVLATACMAGLALTLAASCRGGDAFEPESAAAPIEPTKDAIAKTTEVGPVKATVKVWPGKPTLADPIYVRLEVEAPSGVSIDAPFQEAGDQRLGRFHVVGFTRDLVGDRGGGPVRQAGIAVEAAQLVGPARQSHAHERQQRDADKQAEQPKTDGASRWRQPQPQAQPRERQEQPDGGRDRSQRRPQPFPQDAPTGPAERTVEHRLAAFGGARLDLGNGAGTFAQVPLQQGESA